MRRPRILGVSNGGEASFEFSASERECIARIIGHTLACIERELIFADFKMKQGKQDPFGQCPWNFH